jgi:hypothetical protein
MSKKFMVRSIAWVALLAAVTVMKHTFVLLKQFDQDPSTDLITLVKPRSESNKHVVWRTSFRRSNSPQLHGTSNSNSVSVASLVKTNMARQFSWYKACIKEHGTPRRKKNAVPRACPKSMGDDDNINGNPLRSHGCLPTEAVELEIVADQKWTIRTVDGNGRYKNVGGDEFYMVYIEHGQEPLTVNQTVIPSAVALVDDHNDGRYSLGFVTPPPFGKTSSSTTTRNSERDGSTAAGTGRMEVYLQYTCFMGMVHQPSKDGWKTGGAMNAVATFESVPLPFMESWRDRLLSRGGVIRNPTPLNDTNSTARRPKAIQSLSKLDKTIFFGDSLMVQMILTYTQPLEWFYPSKSTTLRNIDMSITMASLEKVKQKLFDLHGPFLQRNGNTAIVLGSAAWDLLHPYQVDDPSFGLHLQACRRLVEHARAKYPSLTILWRLPTAMLVHVAQESCFSLETKKNGMMMFNNPCVDILRYASSSRIDFLYQEQLSLMLEELQVPVIDLYELSYLSAHALRQGDAIHYSIDWNREILAEYIFPEAKEAILRGEAK